VSLLWVKASVRHEPIERLLSFQPTDFPTWQEVHDNFDWDHPKVKAFVADIAKRGVRKPVRVDYENDPPTIENGHTRILAAQKAGRTHVPVRQYEWPGDIDEDEPFGTGD
jgi:hypothetical protein